MYSFWNRFPLSFRKTGLAVGGLGILGNEAHIFLSATIRAMDLDQQLGIPRTGRLPGRQRLLVAMRTYEEALIRG